jgi:hypothetical protein
MRLTTWLICMAAAALAQGTQTKSAPSEYPVHGLAGEVGVGADYVVQSVGSPKASFIADRFLVVEIAVFPPKTGMTVTTSAFTLRVNRKNKLLAQTPSMVAASLKYPDWERPRGLTVGAGPVIIGRPTPVERFPGDNRPAQSRLPGPVPRAPTDSSGGAAQSEETDVSEIVAQVSLPEGPRRQPLSGYVFFPWSGKLSKIKSVELLVQFEPSREPVILRLR